MVCPRGLLLTLTLLDDDRSRLPPQHVFYYRCPRHRLRYVLTLSLSFATEEDVYQVALTYPFSFTRMQQRLNFYEILSCKSNEGREYLSTRGRSRDGSSSRDGNSGRRGKQAGSSDASSSRGTSGRSSFSIFHAPSSGLLFRRESLGQTLVSLFSLFLSDTRPSKDGRWSC